LHLLLGVAAASIVARHLEQESRRSFLERHLIAELAQHDPLTGLKNRRVFDEHLESLWKQAVAEMRSMAVLLVDVDHFKAYNDLHGHQAGDRALRRVAQALLALVTGPRDVIGRYGGEEFAVILYDADAETAETLAQRMLRAVSELKLEDDAHRAGASVTISIGVAAVEPSRERRSRGALQLADQALYEAKVRGRNRVIVMDQAAHRLLQTGVFAKISSAGR
jgi:diguanylate cyclase (GGDEF)-like protein